MTYSYVSKMLGEDEEILLTTRQHSLVLFGNILLEIFLIALFSVAISLVFILAVPTGIWVAAVWLIGAILLLFPLIGLVHDVLVWANKQFIITSRRVIQVSGIINKNVTDSSLEKVNDVKMVQSFWGRLLNYGDLEILTASEMGVNVFRRIGNPVKVKTTMLNAKNRLGDDDDSGRFNSRIKTVPAAVAVPDMLQELDVLRQKGIITEEEFQKKKEELLARF